MKKLSVLIAVATIVAFSACSEKTDPVAGNSPAPERTDAVFEAAVVGLCATSAELERSGDVAAAYQVFLDQAHLPLHALADALIGADRDVAADLLRNIEETNTHIVGLATQKATPKVLDEAQQVVSDLSASAVEGLRVLSVTPPDCAE
jgi:hypothetical protein